MLSKRQHTIAVLEPSPLDGDCIIMGDVHGNIDCLNQMLAILKPKDRLFIAGDLVDKGHDSPGVVMKILEINSQSATPRIYVTRGNHEKLVLNAIQDYEPFVTSQARLLFGEKKVSGPELVAHLEDILLETYPFSVRFHLESHEGDWLTDLFHDELAAGYIFFTESGLKLTIDYSPESKIKKIRDYFAQLPVVTYVKPGLDIEPLYIVHGDLCCNHTELQRRIAIMHELADDALDLDEQEYCLWARNQKDHDTPIQNNNRTYLHPRTYGGHHIVYIPGVPACRPETNFINLDTGAYFSNVTLYVRHRAKTVGYVGQENRAAVEKHVSNAKTLQQIIQQVQYHLDGRFAVFYEILAKIKNHKFILHGFLDKPEGKEGKHSESTEKIINVIEHHLNPEKLESITFCAQFIRHQLRGKTTPNNGSLFFGYGARDPSTAALHLEILQILDRVLPEQAVALVPIRIKIS